MLVNQTDDRLGQNDQPDRGRNREQHHQPHRMRERAAKFDLVAERGAAGNEWKRNRGNGDAENPQRQLHEAKRNVQPGHRAVAERRGESAVHRDVHLHGAGRDGGRPHQRENCAHPGIAPIEVGPETKTDPA